MELMETVAEEGDAEEEADAEEVNVCTTTTRARPIPCESSVAPNFEVDVVRKRESGPSCNGQSSGYLCHRESNGEEMDCDRIELGHDLSRCSLEECDPVQTGDQDCSIE